MRLVRLLVYYTSFLRKVNTFFKKTWVYVTIQYTRKATVTKNVTEYFSR